MTRNELHSLWLKQFAQGISKKELEKYVVSTGNYLWHIFSWNLLDEKAFLTGNNARKAFDLADKHNAVYIEWFEDDETKILSPTFKNANSLDKMTEVYVVASDFSWTYIKTHECMCGPYFMQL